MASGRTAKLNTGAVIPLIGLGTYLSPGDQAYNAVLTALKAGYRHIDTAQYYSNEKEVGKAIRDSSVPREEIFVTTKLWNNFHHPEDVAKGLQESLDKLDIGYIDLFLMHWPCAFKPGPDFYPKDENGKLQFDPTDFTETYAAMEKLVGGKVRAIGVSNFGIKQLEKLLKTAKIVPAVNQVELHPYLPQDELLEFCKKHGIHVTAYSPLGSTDSLLLKDEKVLEIAKKCNKSPAQIVLAWGLKRGTSVIPKSVTASRIIENFQDVELEEEDFKAINSIFTEPKRVVNPPWDYPLFE